jgi:hypothetical protein
MLEERNEAISSPESFNAERATLVLVMFSIYFDGTFPPGEHQYLEEMPSNFASEAWLKAINFSASS